MNTYRDQFHDSLYDQAAWVATWFTQYQDVHPYIGSIDALWETVRYTTQTCTREAFRLGAKIAKAGEAIRMM